MRTSRASVMTLAIVLFGLAPMAATAQTGEGYIEGAFFDTTADLPAPEGLRVGFNLYTLDGVGLAGPWVDWLDENGRYRIGPIPAGTYKVEFVDAALFVYQTAWWPDGADFTSAGATDVMPDQTTIADWSVRRIDDTPGGVIEGRLINEVSGEPLGDWVSVLAFDESETLVGEMVEPTDSEGRYRLGPLPPGSYRLQFTDARLTGLLTEWWPDQPDFTTAGLVEVVPGMTTGNVDFYLARPIDNGGWISGSVTDATNQMPLPLINWSLYDLEGNLVVAGDRTDSAGSYRVGDLGSGSFKLAFGDSAYLAYEPAWYGGASFKSAAVLVVIEGEELSDINIALALKAGTMTPLLPYGGIPATEYLMTSVALMAIGFSMLVLTSRIQTE